MIKSTLQKKKLNIQLLQYTMVKSEYLVLFISLYHFVVTKAPEKNAEQSSTDTTELFKNFNEVLQETFQQLFKKDDSYLKENEHDILGYPEVQTGKGKILGQTNQHGHSFYGIPYAE